MRQADLRLRRRAVASQHGSQLESSGQDAPDDDTYGKIRSIAIQQRAVSAVPPRPCPGERDFQTNSQVARPDREVTAGEALMEDSAKEQSAVMLFERNDRLVCEAFRNGDFDYIDAAGELSETDFFRAIASKQVLEKLAATYPSPAKKHDVPLWVYIASNISMRFHGVHQFNAYPYVVRAGGMVQAFGPKMGHKAVHPDTGDGTYLFVPDNDAYESSSRLLFDEHNHPVDSTKLTKKEQAAYTWKRCYKLVSLIHTNRAGEFFLYAGLRVVSGKDHECPLLYELIDDFVRFHGRGIIKRLILDRGFIDGPSIGRCKREHHIDVLIPAKTN